MHYAALILRWIEREMVNASRECERGAVDTRREADTARPVTVIAPGRALVSAPRHADKSINQPAPASSKTNSVPVPAAVIAIYQLGPFIRQRRRRSAHARVLKL